MTINKNLYTLLKENKYIKSEKYILEPHRVREKQNGYMWEADLEVKLNSDARILFFFFHHCYDDNGGDWCPSEKELDSYWTPRFVPSENNSSARLVDAYWHLVHVDDHIYISKEGFFTDFAYQNQLIDLIKNDQWKNNSDIWCLI